ncbi:MAG: amidase domain-containing protein [Bacillota bacterium]
MSETIEGLVSSYFGARQRYLLTGDTAGFQRLLAPGVWAGFEAPELRALRSPLLKRGIQVTDCDLAVTWRMSQQRGSWLVEAIENLVLTATASGWPGYLQSQVANAGHHLRCRPVKGRWVVVELSSDNDFTVGRPRIRRPVMRCRPPVISAASPTAYDRPGAAAYALAWWNRRNPKYKDWTTAGGDCTNFTSQCLHEGGQARMDPPAWYYYSASAWAPSWIVADAQNRYLLRPAPIRGPRASLRERASELELGDLIHYDFQGDGRIDHTAIVTGFIYGLPLITQHTVDARDLLWDKGAAKTYFLHIEGWDAGAVIPGG